MNVHARCFKHKVSDTCVFMSKRNDFRTNKLENTEIREFNTTQAIHKRYKKADIMAHNSTANNPQKA